MSLALSVSKEIEALASAIERIAAPVGRAIDEVAFDWAPPRVVTFEAIERAIHARLLGVPQPDEKLEPIRYCDQVVVGEGSFDDFELTSEELLRATADCMRGAAEKLITDPPEEAAQNAAPVRAIARYLVYNIVAFAQLVGEQLLVLELARAIGADPVPLPDQLWGGGSA